MSKTRKILNIGFWVPIVVCLAMIIPYENDWLLAGNLENDKLTEYYVAIALELITICLIPLALRLFKFKRLQSYLMAAPDERYLPLAAARMAMLTVPMMVNCFLYYQFVNVAFGYMGIIDLLAMVFIYPSKTRCQQETTPVNDKK